MNTDKTKVLKLVDASLDLTSEQELDDFLRSACAGDQELHKRVVSLVAAYKEPKTSLEKRQDDQTFGVIMPSIERSGAIIDRYKLLEHLGEGGMGTVWLAEQIEPVQRRVALKVIRQGMDSGNVLARFEAERQALALMDHENIAKVLDAGTTPAGRPYFVMDLVKGIPITTFCDEHRLSICDRLELFIPVCQAIQHAHQKGVIHRDVKPSNVLVAMYDGRPVPKVIDFGVAKATGQRLTQRTIFTEVGSLVGTPEYMSPEQAELNQLDIDTRSDIYSLGVLLYELLSGSTPITREALREAAFDEVLRRIRQEDPAKPSARLTESKDRLTTISAQRKVQPSQLTKAVRGDLDSIVMKALEKDRTRRYETANGLSMDIKRYLCDEPIVARPSSSWYRAGKWAKRRPATASLAAGLVVAAMACGVLGIYASKQAVHAAKQAIVATRNAKEAALAQERAEDGQRLARKNLYVARITLARRALEEGNAHRAIELLENQKPDASQEDLRGFEWYYLWRVCHRDRKTLQGLGGRSGLLCRMPDGKLLSARAGSVTLRDFVSGELTGSFGTSDMAGFYTAACALSPDGKLLAAGVHSPEAKGPDLLIMWRIELEGAKTDGAGTTNLGGASQTSNVFIRASLSEMLRIEEEKHAIQGLTFSPDGRFLAMGTGDKPKRTGNDTLTRNDWSPNEQVRIWDLAARSWIVNLTGHTGDVRAVTFSSNGRLLAAASTVSVKLWDVATWKNIGTLRSSEEMSGWVQSISFSPDSQSLAAAVGHENTSGGVWIWDVATQTARSTIKSGSGVRFLTYSPDGGVLATASLNAIRLWNPTNGEPIAVLAGHTSTVIAATFSQDGQTLASEDIDGITKLWDADSQTETEMLDLRTPDGWGFLAVSANGNHLAQQLSGSVLKVWDLSTHVERVIKTSHRDFIGGVVFTRDAETLATVGSNDHIVKLWNAMTTAHLGSIKTGTQETRRNEALAFSPDGRTLAVSTPTAVRLFDVSTLAELESARWSDLNGNGITHQIEAVAFSPDGKFLATSGFHETAIWDVKTRRMQRLIKHGGRDRFPRPDEGDFTPNGGRIAFSPDSERFATTSAFLSTVNGEVQLWSMNSEKPLTVRGFATSFSALAFSNDGKTLAASSWDGTVKLLHVGTGQEMFTFRNAWGGESQALCFTADGNELVSAGNGKVALWRSKPAKHSP